MLTKELLRYKIDKGVVKPAWLRATPATVRAVEAVLRTYRDHIGATQSDLDEELQRVAAAARSSVMVRGLAKILSDRCRFDDPTACADLRWSILIASAQRMAGSASGSSLGDPLAHRHAIADELSIDDDVAEVLYADLPHLARLREVPAWSVERCIAEYNGGLAQGLLLRSEALVVRLPAAEVAVQRRVLVALRFHRLLAEVLSQEGGELCVRIAGPGSVIDQGRRYGLQLANFLPALAACPQWTAEADLADLADLAEGAGAARLTLSHELGLPGRERSQAWVPEELRDLCQRLAEKCPDWQVAQASMLLTATSGELIIPDVEIRVGHRMVAVECFHRWHHAALERRLQQLRAQPDLPLIIGVDRSLAKRKAVAPLLECAPFADRGFLFSGYPSPSSVRKAVAHLLS